MMKSKRIPKGLTRVKVITGPAAKHLMNEMVDSTSHALFAKPKPDKRAPKKFRTDAPGALGA